MNKLALFLQTHFFFISAHLPLSSLHKMAALRPENATGAIPWVFSLHVSAEKKLLYHSQSQVFMHCLGKLELGTEKAFASPPPLLGQFPTGDPVNLVIWACRWEWERCFLCPARGSRPGNVVQRSWVVAWWPRAARRWSVVKEQKPALYNTSKQ